MTKYNKTLIDKLEGRTLAKYTNDYMKPYIDEYNQKQRKSDRKKSYDYATAYVEEQNKMATSRQNYKAGQLAYEYVIQFGDHKSMDVNKIVNNLFSYDYAMDMFEDFIKRYQEKYPHIHIIFATVHMDEPNGTPHMHILVQPIGEGYKQGLSHQVSLTKALACDGFDRSDKKSDRLSLTRWQNDVKDNIMEPILNDNFYKREYKDGEKHHMPVEVYKRVAAERDIIIEDAKENAVQMESHALEMQAEAKRLIDEAEDKQEKLLKEPERLLETDAGKNAIEKEKNNIVTIILTKFVDSMISFVRWVVIDSIKKYLYKLICSVVEKALHDHGCPFNEYDRRNVVS